MAYLRDNPSAGGVRRFLRMGYEAFPGACSDSVRTLFDVVAAGRMPVLVHCTAGKDRTGFLIAMLLLGMVADYKDVLNDYLKSASGIGEKNVEGSRFAIERRLSRSLDSAALHELIGVREEFLISSLRRIAETYGAVSNYLAAIGLPQRRSSLPGCA